jgi:predicted nucleic acid-binding protein
MVTYVLDSSAILRYLHNDAGSERVAEIIKAHLAGTSAAVVSAAHWGEVAGNTCKTHGLETMHAALARLNAFGIQVIEVDAGRAVRTALIKLKNKIPYVDAFGVELAAESADRVFVTADFDLKPARGNVAIEFLARK